MPKEYRLYGWVPYNISPIQQGIQFGHAAASRHMRDFANMFAGRERMMPDGKTTTWGREPDIHARPPEIIFSAADIQESHRVDRWAQTHETFIILNGGTTNEGLHYGMQGIDRFLTQVSLLLGHKVPFHSVFREPDINDTTTALVFVATDLEFDKRFVSSAERASLGMVIMEKLYWDHETRMGRGSITDERTTTNPIRKSDRPIDPMHYSNVYRVVERIGLRAAIMQWYLPQFKLA